MAEKPNDQSNSYYAPLTPYRNVVGRRTGDEAPLLRVNNSRSRPERRIRAYMFRFGFHFFKMGEVGTMAVIGPANLCGLVDVQFQRHKQILASSNMPEMFGCLSVTRGLWSSVHKGAAHDFDLPIKIGLTERISAFHLAKGRALAGNFLHSKNKFPGILPELSTSFFSLFFQKKYRESLCISFS